MGDTFKPSSYYVGIISLNTLDHFVKIETIGVA
jgi:hypothetical protein